MSTKLFIKVCAMVLATVSLLTFASCSDDEGEQGNILSQEQVGNSGTNNKAPTLNNGNAVNSAETKFASAYINWFDSDVIGGFEKGMQAAISGEKVYDGLSIRTISSFFTLEVKEALLSVTEFEKNKNFTNPKVKEIKRNKSGSYDIKMTDGGNDKQDADYELNLSANKKEISFIKYNENADALLITEVILTDDGYIAIQRSQRPSVSDKWENVQMMFKGSEGYYFHQENLDNPSASIYESSFPQGFAGKK